VLIESLNYYNHLANKYLIIWKVSDAHTFDPEVPLLSIGVEKLLFR
jgi:hypothetical protein